MNVLDKHTVLRLRTTIIQGFEVKDSPIEFKKYKQRISTNYGIFFYNIMKTTNKEMWTIMAKRSTSTYIYSFNSDTKELKLKGERKHAYT